MTTSYDRKFRLAYEHCKHDVEAWSRERFILLPGYGKEDLEQEIYTVLHKAVQTYDPTKGMKFDSWWRLLRDRRFADLLKRARVKSREPEHFWQELDADAVRSVFSEASAEEEALAFLTVHEEAELRRQESSARYSRRA